MKNRKPREKRASFYDAHFYDILDYFILAVLVAGVLIFILYPLLCMIRQSFVGEEGFSTEVYKSIFSANLQLVKNSDFCRCFIRILFNNSGAACINLCMDSREETGQISGSDFADQHGFAAVYCFARLYPAFRKKRSDHKRSVRTFAEPVWMAWCCCNADVILFFIKCTDDYRNAEENGYVARKSIF